MARRKTDQKNKSWFRSERIFSNDQRWYFHTREGTIEGPYQNEGIAKEQLKFYIERVSPGAFTAPKVVGFQRSL
ncbi:MAG: DUF6316 family protein [Halioglobus sp.]